jgi:hypothetical protein
MQVLVELHGGSTMNDDRATVAYDIPVIAAHAKPVPRNIPANRHKYFAELVPAFSHARKDGAGQDVC